MREQIPWIIAQTLQDRMRLLRIDATKADAPQARIMCAQADIIENWLKQRGVLRTTQQMRSA